MGGAVGWCGSITMARNAPGWRWQDGAPGADFMDEAHITRRVVGFHDYRLDGLSDLLMRAHGASVIDVGCNKGHAAWEFVANGARLVHGCDIHAPSIVAAKHWFAEIPHCETRFEVVDLSKPDPLAVFGADGYDIVLFIGVYHKLVRVMESKALEALLLDLGKRALQYLAFMGYPEHLQAIDDAMKRSGLRRIHTSELAYPNRPAAIYKRGA